MIISKNSIKFNVDLIEEHTVHVHFKKSNVFRDEDIADIRKEMKEHSLDVPIKVLIELDENTYFDFDGAFKANKDYVLPIAEAIVPNSLANRLIVEYYYATSKDSRNHKIFKNKAEALKWLKSV
ncbi:hypothetical protein DNU06_07085 [Putridiphycobacter roseus]|uniref:DUF7793 domain-containing protein n=1 Tax=Putridiphycobacter roseus TaxID=2219161 RepID=A0A2W1NI32_9FLAO|nr:hypothetical protein [Putridiphycobacter roseus]PZE17586.1 hypothetical protein DNU06_07085 [Putridiphycobacter roseus]